MKKMVIHHSWYQNTWFGIVFFSVILSLTGFNSSNIKAQTAVPLTVNALPISASIGIRGENDIYSFKTGTTGGTFTMQTYGTVLNTYMYLYRLSGTTPIVIAEDNDSGNGTNAKITKTLSANMTYYIRVKSFSATAIGGYYINVVKEPYYQPPRNLSGTAGNASITLNWKAPWTETLPRGYNVYTSAAENGIYLRQGTTSSTSATIKVTPKSTHWYYITAVYPAGESVPSNKVGVTALDANILTVGATINGTIDNLKEDWYRFYIPNIGAYTNYYNVLAGSPANEADMLMYLYQSDMTTLIARDENTNPYWNAVLSQNFGVDKWYYVKVKASYFISPGSYTINLLRTVGVYNVNLIVDAIPYKSTINPGGEYELYRFMTGPAGNYTIQSFGSLNTRIILHDGQPSNDVLETDEDDGVGLNAMISRSLTANKQYYFYITAPSSGEYSVEVKGPGSGSLSKVGNTTIYSSTSTTLNRRAQPVTMTEAGTISSVTIYHGGGTGNMILAVYNTSGGLPNQRIAVTPSTPVNGSAGWQTVNLSTPVSVSQGSTIWLAWVFQNNVSARYTSGTPGRAQSSETWSGGMPASFGTSSTSGSIYSIYANYTPGGGSTNSKVGNTTVYTSTSTALNRRAQPVTMTEAGTIKSVAIYHGGGTGNMILAVYNTSGGLPNQRIAVTPSTPVNGSAGWQTVNLSSPVAVSQGSTIWLAWVFQNTVSARYTSGTPGRAQSSEMWSGGMPASFGTSSTSGSIYSIYANYTPGSTKSAGDNPVQINEPLVQKADFEFNVYPTLVSTDLNIDVIISEAQHATIRVYDITGRILGDLWNGTLEKGENHLYFDDMSVIRSNSGSDMRIIQLIINNKIETRKILLADD